MKKIYLKEESTAWETAQERLTKTIGAIKDALKRRTKQWYLDRYGWPITANDSCAEILRLRLKAEGLGSTDDEILRVYNVASHIAERRNSGLPDPSLEYLRIMAV